MTTLLLMSAGVLLFTSFIMGSRTRLRSLVTLFRFQALALALFAFVAASLFGEPHLMAVAALVLALKVVVMPTLLLRVAKKTGASERLPTYVRGTTLSLIATGAIISGVFLAFHLPFDGNTFFVATAFSVALIGFELLITHRNLFGQGMGFLVFENGIFFLGLALVHGIPIFIEIGILFDLVALLVLLTALIGRVHEVHASVATDYLEALNDL